MRTTRYYIQICLFVIPSLQIKANKLIDNESNTEKKHHEIIVSAFTGFSLGGSESDISQQMIKSGLDDFKAGYNSTSYPSITKKMNFDLEMAYYFRMNMGISINYALVENNKVSGFKETGILPVVGGSSGIDIVLYGKVWAFSVMYQYLFTDVPVRICIAPSYFKHEVFDQSPNSRSPPTVNMLPGLTLGASVYIVDRKNWFLGLKTLFRIAPKSGIGPFDASEYIHNATFPMTRVNISSVNIGISLGIKISIIQE